MGLLATMLSFFGCDVQNIADLQAGISTEADVRAKFGQPEKIWEGSNDSRLFEYNRQPAGHVNYMIRIDANGKYVHTLQVLNKENFSKVVEGMMMEDVRKMLGKPKNTITYPLKPNETYYNWRWMDTNTSMIFSVIFDQNMRVIRTESGLDREDPRNMTP